MQSKIWMILASCNLNCKQTMTKVYWRINPHNVSRDFNASAFFSIMDEFNYNGSLHNKPDMGSLKMARSFLCWFYFPTSCLTYVMKTKCLAIFYWRMIVKSFYFILCFSHNASQNLYLECVISSHRAFRFLCIFLSTDIILSLNALILDCHS